MTSAMTSTVTSTTVGNRIPVAIDDGLLRAGTQTAAFDSDDPETLLRNYLRLVRRSRSQQRAPEILLRREDVDAISDYLGVSSEHVLNRLATLMGSSRTQRTTMLAVFASGALLIGLAGSASANSSVATIGELGGESAAQQAVPSVVVDDTADDPSATKEPGAVPDAVSDAVADDAGSPISAQPNPVSEFPSTVVVGDVGADRPAVEVVVDAPVVSAPVLPPASVSDQVPVGSNNTGGDVAADPLDDVGLVTPVIPAAEAEVAVGDAVVPPVVVPTTIATPVVDDSDPSTPPSGADGEQPPVDEIPHELPPVDDDTVAVGPPPVPPTTTVPAETAP